MKIFLILISFVILDVALVCKRRTFAVLSIYHTTLCKKHFSPKNVAAICHFTFTTKTNIT